MKKNGRNHLNIFLIFCFCVLCACSSSNRLREYDFRDHTVAAQILTEPAAEISTDSFTWIDRHDPIGSILRVGTTIYKEVETARFASRLDSALQLVDVPEEIKLRTMDKTTRVMHYQPLDDTKNADYLWDIDLRHYGIDAESWNSAVLFKIDVKVTLIDNKNTIPIWKAHIKEKQPASSVFFGIGPVTDNIFTAVALAKLSTEEIAVGLESLADYAAGRIVKKLQKDLLKAREPE